jgi:hypothetical protein
MADSICGLRGDLYAMTLLIRDTVHVARSTPLVPDQYRNVQAFGFLGKEVHCVLSSELLDMIMHVAMEPPRV